MFRLRGAIRYLSNITGPEFPPSLLNLKVGRIIECKKHENAEKLYISQIQVEDKKDGLDEPVKAIQVCSGLANFVPIEQMQNKRVVVLTNLKPSKMRGEKSEAMLLAASNDSETNGSHTIVELVNPPLESKVGERLFFQTFSQVESPPRLKSKVWSSIQSKLMVNKTGVAVYVDENNVECPLSTIENKNYAYVDSLKNSPIS